MTKRSGNAPVYVRLDSDLRRRLKDEADERTGGNESEVGRQAIKLYLDLRETHGAHFELILEGLRANGRKAGQVSA